jgi:hypothetical protein
VTGWRANRAINRNQQKFGRGTKQKLWQRNRLHSQMDDFLIRQRAVQNPAQKRGESADLPFPTLLLDYGEYVFHRTKG